MTVGVSIQVLRNIVPLTEIEAMGILELRPWREIREEARVAALERFKLSFGERENAHRGSGRTWHILLSALLTAARGFPVWIAAYTPRYAEQLVLLVQRWAIECGVSPSLFKVGRPVPRGGSSPVPTVDRETEFVSWLRDAAEEGGPRRYASWRALGADWAQQRLVELDEYMQETKTDQVAINRLIYAHGDEAWPDFGLIFDDHYRLSTPHRVGHLGYDTGRDFARDVQQQALEDPRIDAELHVLASALDPGWPDVGESPEDPRLRIDALRAWMLRELRVDAAHEYRANDRQQRYIVEVQLPCGCPHTTETLISDLVLRGGDTLTTVLAPFRLAAIRNLADALVEHLYRGVEHNRRWLQQMNYRDTGALFTPMGGPWQGP